MLGQNRRKKKRLRNIAKAGVGLAAGAGVIGGGVALVRRGKKLGVTSPKPASIPKTSTPKPATPPKQTQSKPPQPSPPKESALAKVKNSIPGKKKKGRMSTKERQAFLERNDATSSAGRRAQKAYKTLTGTGSSAAEKATAKKLLKKSVDQLRADGDYSQARFPLATFSKKKTGRAVKEYLFGRPVVPRNRKKRRAMMLRRNAPAIALGAVLAHDLAN